MNRQMPQYNTAEPLVMHIDLNSCFATIEQQARPMLRGRPVAVTNRRTENTALVTASYEAKAKGVKVGMSLREAKRLCPGLIAVESDPIKYRYVYHKLMAIMNDYSPMVRMKSIDEGVIDFAQSPAAIRQRNLRMIGHEIKERLRHEIGCWMRCNVGIGTNRFLAKMAAGLHKPDGLDELTSHNIESIFAQLTLRDLTGIAGANERRLNSIGITSPLAMLDASTEALAIAFHSAVLGAQWQQRLHGWEVDDKDHDLKSCGRQYVLERSNLTADEKMQRLHSLAEGVGAKLRHSGKAARGVRIFAQTYGGGRWQAHYLAALPFFSNAAIWKIVRRLSLTAPSDVSMFSVTCYHLHEDAVSQLSLFGDELARERQLVRAIDDINARWGERAVHAGSTVGLDEIVKTKIPFGSTRYL